MLRFRCTCPSDPRKISLDDTVELYLLKTGDFVERGYDDARGKYYYKLFFSKEK